MPNVPRETQPDPEAVTPGESPLSAPTFSVVATDVTDVSADTRDRFLDSGWEGSESRDADRQMLANQLSVLLQYEGMGLFELTIILGKAFKDLLRLLDSSDFKGFAETFKLYFPSGFSTQLIKHGLVQSQSAGHLLISDTIHTLANISTDKSIVAQMADTVRQNLQIIIEAFDRYQETEREDAFWTRQNTKQILESPWAAFNQKEIFGIQNDAEVLAPVTMLKTVLSSFKENAHRVCGDDDPLATRSLLTLRATQHEDVVRCHVFDDLPSFPPEKLEKLFDEVLQSISPDGHGTGLLRLAKQMKLIGGVITSYHLIDGRWLQKSPNAALCEIPNIESVVSNLPAGTTKFFILDFPVASRPVNESDEQKV